MFAELLQDAEDSLRGYCRGMSVDLCKDKLRRDLNDAFTDFNLSLDTFFQYPLFALKQNESSYMHDGKPVFTGKVSIEYLGKKINYSTLTPKEDETPYLNLSSIRTIGYRDGKNWPFSAMVGKFTSYTIQSNPVLKKTHAGMLSFDSNYTTLGICNFGYKPNRQVPPNYIFLNEPDDTTYMPPDEDPGCEGTFDSLGYSIVKNKFNCYHGMKWTDEDIKELEILKIRNPGFENEDVFIESPTYPYQTTWTGLKPNLRLYEIDEDNPFFYNPEVDKIGCPLNIGEQSVKENVSILDHVAAYSSSQSITKKENGFNTLTKLAKKMGKMLLYCFSQWTIEHPDINVNVGDYFADNFTNFVIEYFGANQTYKEIGLDVMVDFKTLIKAFFYAGKEMYYYKTKNLGASTTFMQLFKETEEDPEMGIDCTSANRNLCYIRRYMIEAPSTYEPDFRISKKLFNYLYFNDDKEIVNMALYLNDDALEGIGRSTYFDVYPPTQTMFERYLINSSMKVKRIGYPIYGINFLSDQVDDRYPILARTYNGVSLNASLMSVQKGRNEFQEGFMIWPYVPHLDSDHDILIYGVDSSYSEHRGFYQFTQQPFNASSRVVFGDKMYNVGDRYYRIGEEVDRDGHSDSYNTVWIFGDNGIAKNLTLWRKCVETEVFGWCLEEYLPWFDSCSSKNIDDEISCLQIKDVFRKLGLYKENEKLSKEDKQLIPIIIFSSMVVIGVILVVVFINCRKEKEKSSMSDLYEQI